MTCTDGQCMPVLSFTGLWLGFCSSVSLGGLALPVGFALLVGHGVPVGLATVGLLGFGGGLAPPTCLAGGCGGVGGSGSP
jgi:hypothetical protein